MMSAFTHPDACRKTGENVREEGDTCRQRFPQQVRIDCHFPFSR